MKGKNYSIGEEITTDSDDLLYGCQCMNDMGFPNFNCEEYSDEDYESERGCIKQYANITDDGRNSLIICGSNYDTFLFHRYESELNKID